MKNYNNIIIEIYQKIYSEAKPKANFKELMKKGVTTKAEWFMKYNLDNERQVKIIETICKKYKLDERTTRKMRTEILLGCAPNGTDNEN